MQRYRPADRPEVFDFLRNVFSPTESARIIGQWDWKYEANPFNPPEGPIVFITRIGREPVSMVAGFRFPAWIGGATCEMENLGMWVVHPTHRRQRIWARVENQQVFQAPMAISWGRRLSARIGIKSGWVPSPMNPMLRIIDPAQVIKHFSGISALASLADAAQTAGRSMARPFRHTPGRSDAAIRLQGFDQRCDELWERARRDDLAMVIRNRRYLQWRYCDRPDARYSVFGVEQSSELMGLLVARITSRNELRWGYLVDFIVARGSDDHVLATLIEAALVDFRRSGVAAASCYASDPRCRGILMRHGFFRAPQRDPMHLSLRANHQRSDLTEFASPPRWYITMGDGDLELAS
jgi:hypothetical protein